MPSAGGADGWHRTTLRQILENPIYVGRRAWGKTSQGRFFRQRAGQIEAATGDRKAVWHPPKDWFTTDDTPAFIDPAVWEAAQRQRSDGSLGQLRKAVAALEGKLVRARGRLVEVSVDMVPEVEAQIRAVRVQLEAAQKELHDAETADSVRELKVTAEAARKALAALETAIEGATDVC